MKDDHVNGYPLIDEHWTALAQAMDRARDASPRVQAWGEHLSGVLRNGGRLLTCGNGGSAAEAQHLTGELVGRYVNDRRPFSAIALHADTSSVTAIINDYGEHELFARQVMAHGRPEDVLLALSASGRSQNVVSAAKTARELGLTVWALTGPAPNRLAAACHDTLAVDAPCTSTIQEVHLAVVHALCAVIDATLGVAP